MTAAKLAGQGAAARETALREQLNQLESSRSVERESLNEEATKLRAQAAQQQAHIQTLLQEADLAREEADNLLHLGSEVRLACFKSKHP